MKAYTTNLVAHFLWPGLIIAYLIGDRKNSRFFLKQSLILNIIAFLLIFIGLIPLPLMGMIEVVGNFILALCWAYSFAGALLGKDFTVPLFSREGFQKMKEDMGDIFEKQTDRKDWSHMNEHTQKSSSEGYRSYQAAYNKNLDEFADSLGNVSLEFAVGFCKFMIGVFALACGMCAISLGCVSVYMIYCFINHITPAMPTVLTDILPFGILNGIGLIAGICMSIFVAILFVMGTVALIKGLLYVNKNKDTTRGI
jgi:hypothetical protein